MLMTSYALVIIAYMNGTGIAIEHIRGFSEEKCAATAMFVQKQNPNRLQAFCIRLY